MRKKESESKVNKIKSNLKSYSWLLWVIPLLIIASFTNGIDSGLFLSGIIISGATLGAIIQVSLGAVFKKDNLKIIYGEIIIFIICTILLYLFVPDKKLLIFIIPFSIPSIIIGIRGMLK